MITDNVNIEEQARMVSCMGIMEQLAIVKVMPTKLLIDEISNRLDDYELKLDKVFELVNTNEHFK